MGLTPEERALALEEALRQYLRHLSDVPPQGKGKGVETTADLRRESHQRSKIWFLEACLRFAARIAVEVPRWVDGPVGDAEGGLGADGEGRMGHGKVTDRRRYEVADSDTEPYVNPFTGMMIVPKTLFTPGPSGCHEVDAANEIDDHAFPKLDQPPDQTQHRKREIYLEIPAKLTSSKTDSQSQDSQSSGWETQSSSTPPQVSPTSGESNISASGDLDLRADIYLATKLQAEWSAENELLEKQKQFANSISNGNIDSPGVFDLGILEARRLQAQIDEEVRQNQQAIQAAVQFEQDLVVSRRLHEQWAQENDIIRQDTINLQRQWHAEEDQLRLAQEIAHAEDERMASIRRDMLVAQKLQKQWEDETKEEAERARKVAMEEKRAEKERHRLREQQRQEMQRQEAERRERHRLEAERIANQVDCLACMDSFHRNEMCMLPCQHGYCGECIQGAFQNAITSRKPLKCCGSFVPAACASRFLPSAFISSYASFLLEFSTKKPRYCSNVRCAAFIPPQHIHGPVGICPKCRHRTCTQCGNQEHAGVCPEDKAGNAVLNLAREKGWKSCPKCSFVVSRNQGCLHMTCRCGAEWCWNCLRSWRSCNSTCGR